MAQRHHHRTDPSEGGWDTTIVKAPDSHKRRKRRRHRSKGQKALATVGKVLGGIVIAVVAIAAAVGIGILVASFVTNAH